MTVGSEGRPVWSEGAENTWNPVHAEHLPSKVPSPKTSSISLPGNLLEIYLSILTTGPCITDSDGGAGPPIFL